MRVGLVVAAIVWAAPAMAQGTEPEREPRLLERAGISGSIRAGYWSSTRDLDREDHLAAGMLWIKSSRTVWSNVSFLVEGWTALRGRREDGRAAAEMREAFMDLRIGRLDVRAGRQIIAWGRADGINPTNNLAGEDLTLLTPDDEDRRRGSTAVRGSYYAGDVSLTAIWMPEFRPHRFPLPAAPPGRRVVRGAVPWPGDQWALRAEQTGRAVDWSLSLFRGFDVLPDVGLRTASDDLQLLHRRVLAIGGDMAANVGRFGIRAEAAYVDTEDHDGTDPLTKNPFLFAVAGADRTFGERLNLNVQYIHRFVFARRPSAGAPPVDAAIAGIEDVLSSQTRTVQHGASFRVAYRWLHDTLDAECAAAGYFGPRGAAIRPKIGYEVSDRWRLLAGAEIFRGEPSSLFGLLRPNSTAYVEMRWVF